MDWPGLQQAQVGIALEQLLRRRDCQRQQESLERLLVPVQLRKDYRQGWPQRLLPIVAQDGLLADNTDKVRKDWNQSLASKAQLYTWYLHSVSSSSSKRLFDIWL